MIMLRLPTTILPLLVLTGCTTLQNGQPRHEYPQSEAVTRLEAKSGGRLGVALIDADGELRFAHRGDERFAMCSTFKHLLAAKLLAGATRGGPSLRQPLAFRREDLPPHSPALERLLKDDAEVGETRLGFAAQYMVETGDNGAANLVLAATGGPVALTQWLRTMGDYVTRLDRIEPAINENALGDLRDTTSPRAMATITGRLVYSDHLSPSYRDWLRQWMIDSPTGQKRIRAGLPSEWRVGGKTGSCGNAYNEVAFVERPDGTQWVLAVYLDRPQSTADEANAIIASIAQHLLVP